MLKKERYLYFFIFFSVIGIFLTLLFNSTIINDEIEHLRMSWLVSQGEIPYRDFFEHHHPLTWYLFAPIIRILPQNVILVFYTAKILSFLCVVITYCIIYFIIKRFLGDASLGLYFFVILFTFYPIWYTSSIFKPDVFARLFYFAGLYSFFSYIDQQKLKDLVLCALCFTVAFLFLQTILFSILPLIVPVGVIIYKNPHRLYDFLKAVILPLIVLGGCVYWLVYSNSIKEYYQLNWIFNSHLFSLIRLHAFSLLWIWLLPFLLALTYFIWHIKKYPSSYFFNIIGLLFVSELALHIYYPAVFAHYLVLSFVFAAIILAPALEEILNNKLFASFKIWVFVYLFSMLVLNFVTLGLKNNRQILPILAQVNAVRSDNIVNVSNIDYTNIYAEKTSYYLMYMDLCQLDDTLFHRLPEYDINKFIEKLKPMYLNYNGSSTFNKDDRFIISPKTLKQYILIAPKLYQRKNTLNK